MLGGFRVSVTKAPQADLEVDECKPLYAARETQLLEKIATLEASMA
jgi:hypothetical protein